MGLRAPPSLRAPRWKVYPTSSKAFCDGGGGLGFWGLGFRV